MKGGKIMQNNTPTVPKTSQLKVVSIQQFKNNKKQNKQFAKILLNAITIRQYGIQVIK